MQGGLPVLSSMQNDGTHEPENVLAVRVTHAGWRWCVTVTEGRTAVRLKFRKVKDTDKERSLVESVALRAALRAPAMDRKKGVRDAVRKFALSENTERKRAATTKARHSSHPYTGGGLTRALLVTGFQRQNGLLPASLVVLLAEAHCCHLQEQGLFCVKEQCGRLMFFFGSKTPHTIRQRAPRRLPLPRDDRARRCVCRTQSRRRAL